MTFSFNDDANMSAGGPMYGGYNDFQLLTATGYREATAGDDVIVDSPDTTTSSCHEYPPLIDAPPRMWESIFAPEGCSIDRWIEFNQRFDTHTCQGPAACVNVGTNLCLRAEQGKETPTSGIGSSSSQGTSDEQNLPPRQRPAKFQCKWEGCTYSRRFSRAADLLRHVSAVHLTRGQYLCPIDAGCKPFNRKDNLLAHLQRRHNIAAQEQVV